MKVYTYNLDLASVVERECEAFGWPNTDSTGAKQFDNTHFRTPEEAWEKLRREIEASISLGTSARVQARKRLEDVTSALADDAERLARMKEHHETWEREGVLPKENTEQ